MHACIGEGNGNPLQCSCLENPKDRGACWLPSVRSQSRTRLKRLSNSSSSREAKSFQANTLNDHTQRREAFSTPHPGKAPVPVPTTCQGSRGLTCGPRGAQPKPAAASSPAPRQLVEAVAGAGREDQARRHPAHVPGAAHATSGAAHSAGPSAGVSEASGSRRRRLGLRRWRKEMGD